MLFKNLLSNENVMYFFPLPKLAVANNRIITLQEDVERVKEESSFQMESNRKVSHTLLKSLSLLPLGCS